MFFSTTLLLSSCGAYNSVVDTHNRFVEKHNKAVNDWNDFIAPLNGQ